MKQRLSILLGLGVSLFFLWLGFRGLDFENILATLSNINPIWIGAAVPVYFVATYVLTWRWYYLFRPIKDISPNKLFPVVLIGYMANNLLPLRLGELMCTYVLKKREDVPIAPTLTTIFVERVFDGLVMLSFIFTALLFVEFEEKTLKTVIYITAPLFFGAMTIFFWLAYNPEKALRFYIWLIERFVPNVLRSKALTIINELMAGLTSLRSGRLLVLVISTSFLSWILESSTYWIVMHAFDFSVSFFVLLLVVGFGNLSTILPSTAGYVGTFHAVTILTLTSFGVSRLDAGSYAIIMHATLWAPITLAGFLMLIKLGFGWKDFQKAQSVAENVLLPSDADANVSADRTQTESEATA